MNRKKVTTEDGQTAWFNYDTAERFVEGSRHDGRNPISLATGSQTEHEALFRTASGKWVLNSWSQWQGTTESYHLIDDEDAANWFCKNEYNDDEIPEDIFPLVAQYLNETEL